VAETTKVFRFHVAQLGRRVGFGAIHDANLTTYKSYFDYLAR
jgi:hypothetical protein